MGDKICKLCNKEITAADDYVRLTDYKKGRFLMEGFYHNACYHAQIQNAVMFNKQKLLGKMKNMFPGLRNHLGDVMKNDK